MTCPLCDSLVVRKRRSIADPERNVFFCTGCPMVYLLLPHHEEETIRARRGVIEVHGGRKAFK
jgi:hypothetical protein